MKDINSRKVELKFILVQSNFRIHLVYTQYASSMDLVNPSDSGISKLLCTKVNLPKVGETSFFNKQCQDKMFIH